MYFLLILISVSSLTFGAHLGGLLVYKYGVGVEVVNHQMIDEMSNSTIDDEFETLFAE